MKTTISLTIFLTCFSFILQGQDIVDDVYFRPSEVQKVTQREVIKTPRPGYKNGAKEIIYIDSRDDKNVIVTRDTVYVLGEINDSIAAAENIEEGYYLNDFNGSASDLEYAERIRRFHNPKYTIHISDPQYSDIYFLDDNYWNVYVDGSYAWITPTWTNLFWDNYFWRPYSYNSMYWRNSWYSPYSHYNSWYNDPWSYGMYGNYYGGWGGYYGGYYPGYYGYGGSYYNNYWDYPYWGGNSGWSNTTTRNKNYNEATRRNEYYSGAGRSGNNVTTTRISGSNYSPSVSRNTIVSNSRGERTQNNPVNVRTSGTTVRGAVNNNYAGRTGNVRNTGTVRGINTQTRTTTNVDARATERSSVVNNPSRNTTAPTTSRNSYSTSRTVPVSGSAVTNRSSGSTNVRYGTGTSSVRSSSGSSSSSTIRNNSTNYSSSPSSSSSERSSGSTPTYSAPSSSSRSSSSYSGSSSSGSSSSSSSGGSSGGGSSRSSSGNSGGRR